MLVLDRATGAFHDSSFADLPSLLRPGDLLILNDSRVLPARLFATRGGLHTQASSPGPTGRIEVLLTEDLSQQHPNEIVWRALVRPGRKVHTGELLLFADPAAPHTPLLRAEVLTSADFGERTLRFHPVPDFLHRVEQIGHMPLPPYIHRPQDLPDTPDDRERYQTVYAQPPGSHEHRSAAAPTAGLHFTPETLAGLRARGVEVQHLTLHVGLGTFQPVRVDRTEEIRLHAEPYTLPAATAAAIHAARSSGRRIIAVGTTTTRTLEHCAREAERTGQPIAAHSGSTSLFLSPGLDDRFRLVSGLLTNFHLPGSTLLMLVSAFAGSGDKGREAVLRAYAHAVEQRYRFFSYGDCMLIT
ncbi:MAG: tRNA preQ1(34) S-adenosylmethionine ribosyltransferase-isomerase QueA [Acidobacteriaceae bacterium]